MGTKEDFIALVATVHAETNGSEGRTTETYNERRGIAHATLNNNKASNRRANRYGRSTETLSQTATRIANVHSNGNPRTGEVTGKNFSDWNKDGDVKLSVKAVIHAMAGTGKSGKDNTGGAHGWDGIRDFQKQYEVRSTTEKWNRFKDGGVRLNHYIKGVSTYKGKNGYEYSTTAKIGQTIFFTEKRLLEN